MELGGEPLPIAAEGHVDVVPRRVQNPPARREAVRLPRRQLPGRHVVEPQLAVGGSGHGHLVAGGRERDRGALRSVVGERHAPERGGVEQLGTARPEATDEQRPVRARGQGRDVRRAGSPQFPAQVMNTRQGARPRQCRSEVLPGLGRVVGLDALYREEQTGREVLVQHALSACAAGVREVGCLLRTVPLTAGQVSLACGPVGRPDGDQPGGHRQDQQDDDASQRATQPPVDSPLLRQPAPRPPGPRSRRARRRHRGRQSRCRSGRGRPAPATPGCGRAGHLGRARSPGAPSRPRRRPHRRDAGTAAARRRRRRASRAASARP